MNEYELHLDLLSVEAIADEARRQDCYEAMERDNARLAHERDIALDQRNWAWMIALIACGAHVAQFVWAAVRG